MVEIKEVIEKYVEGTCSGDVDILKSVFHSKAVMSGDLGEIKLEIESPEIFFNDIKGKIASSDYAWNIEKLECFGEIAFASLREDNLHGHSFINQFQLQKIAGEWKIISKLFTTLEGN